ncbi:hypothetical protein Ancab_028905 [Ancistrocladus abbreviatus]
MAKGRVMGISSIIILMLIFLIVYTPVKSCEGRLMKSNHRDIEQGVAKAPPAANIESVAPPGEQPTAAASAGATVGVADVDSYNPTTPGRSPGVGHFTRK